MKKISEFKVDKRAIETVVESVKKITSANNDDEYDELIKFDLETFTDKININCGSEHEAHQLMQIMDKLDIGWETGCNAYSLEIWNENEHETCFLIVDGRMNDQNFNCYEKPYFQRVDYKIVKFKDINFG